MARVGQNSTNEIVRRNYSGVSPKQADIVGSTTNSAARLDSNEFDLVVVDEATQASQPATFVPWLKGDKMVLAGDHRQLPPYCSDETAKDEEMHISLFEHLLDIYGRDIAERLGVQYRMNSDIADFSIDKFYEGEITHGKGNKDWTVNDLSPILGINISGEEETDEDTHSKCNPVEARVVAKEAKKILNEGIETGDIGIITPYTAQIGVIDEALQKVGVDNHYDIKIDTIDSFQGSERKAIIVSFVRSNNRNSSGFLAFPEEGKRRLNVAITRAQRRLSLIGDWETLGNVADYNSSDQSCADVYADLAEYLINREHMVDIDR
jgi:superfamily I DNA and/or RNA helicase